MLVKRELEVILRIFDFLDNIFGNLILYFTLLDD